MREKPQPSRGTSDVASPHLKRLYNDLLIRARSPEPTQEKSTDTEATGSKELPLELGHPNQQRTIQQIVKQLILKSLK